MKKLFTTLAVLSLIFSGSVLAEDVSYIDSGSESASVQIHSSDSNEVRVQNVENMIENKADLTSYVEAINIIEAINNYDSEGFSNRTSLLNWAFALFYLIWLYEYGSKLKRDGLENKRWFRKPLFVGILVYLVHAPLHLLVADPIFLVYYAMIIFDIMLFTFTYYYFVLGFGKIPHSNKKLKV